MTQKRTSKKRKRSFFFAGMGLVALFAVVAGFSKTFFIPVASGTFKAPPVIYIHGGFAFAWIALFFIQTWLIRANNFNAHKRLGILGVLAALGIIVTMIPAGKFEIERGLTQGHGDAAISSIVGIITTSILFSFFVASGLIFRKKTEAHKRLLLLATIVILWPAWFRFRHYFPSVPRPDIWFGVVLADSLIVICWIRDLVARGSVHPVFLYGGLFIIAENVAELILFDSAPWRYLAKMIYNVL